MMLNVFHRTALLYLQQASTISRVISTKQVNVLRRNIVSSVLRLEVDSDPTNPYSSSPNYGDPEEVAKFRRLSDKWWSETGEFRPLHEMNRLRVPLIRDALTTKTWICDVDDDQSPKSTDRFSALNDFSDRPLHDKKILDVGCGGGLLCEPLARLGASVIGVDAVLENVLAARQHLVSLAHVSPRDEILQTRIEYRHCTAEELSLTHAASFDAVVASEVLEHVADWQNLVQVMAKLLKPEGSLFTTTLNRTNLSYLLAIVTAENIFRFVPKGTHDWNKFITPSDLVFSMELNGLNVRLVHGMLYNPMTKSWSWSADTSVNYAVHAVKSMETPLNSAFADNLNTSYTSTVRDKTVPSA